MNRIVIDDSMRETCKHAEGAVEVLDRDGHITLVLAAVLAGKAEPRVGMVFVLSGGNVDPALHARLVA